LGKTYAWAAARVDSSDRLVYDEAHPGVLPGQQHDGSAGLGQAVQLVVGVVGTGTAWLAYRQAVLAAGADAAQTVDAHHLDGHIDVATITAIAELTLQVRVPGVGRSSTADRRAVAAEAGA